MLHIAQLAFLILASAAISQENIPVDFAPEANHPSKQATAQKLGVASNRPLNLVELSAKDTASFETYSKRLALVQDSISATYRAIDAVKKNAVSFMPVFEPKNEFEKQFEFDERKAKWDKELYERIDRDTKSLTTRLAELEKAKKKIDENQVSLYGSVSIKSSPEADSVSIGKEEIGRTPAEYNYLIPGTVKISVRKEDYVSWDTTFLVTPGGKFRFNITLEEKSIFSVEDELDFAKILSKDTTVEGYESRIKVVKARNAQVSKEIRAIQEDFANNYMLEPQKPDETAEDFNKRRESWVQEGIRRIAEFQRKHEVYKQKLDRSVSVLNDYIVSEQSTILNESVVGAKIELGAYDADKEQFELLAQDTASSKSPFYFKGNVGIPRDTARTMDRAAPGFAVNLQFINYSFDNVNLAMSKLNLSRSGLEFKVDGSFSEIDEYKSRPGYDAWKLRADSLLSGALQPKGLDYAYAMGKAAAKDAVAAKSGEGSGGLGWRGWTRIFAFTAAVACGGVAVYKHLQAQEKLDRIHEIVKLPPNASLENEYKAMGDDLTKREQHRSIYGAAAGVFAIGGILTFVF